MQGVDKELEEALLRSSSEESVEVEVEDKDFSFNFAIRIAIIRALVSKLMCLSQLIDIKHKKSMILPYSLQAFASSFS